MHDALVVRRGEAPVGLHEPFDDLSPARVRVAVEPPSERGAREARAQWALACAAINLRKLHAFWVEGRFALAS